MEKTQSALETPVSGSPVSADISRRIMAVRYLGILGVVMCHAVQTPYYIIQGEFPEFLLEDFAMNNWVKTTHSVIMYGFFYGAVTMFYLFAGYIAMSKSRGYVAAVLRRVRSLVAPMILWSVISIALLYWLNNVVKLSFRGDLLSSRDMETWIKAMLGNYEKPFVRGTHSPNFMFQFWFVRDLFILTLLSPALKWLARNRKTAAGAVVVFGAIIASGCRPVIVGADSLFYYYLGMFFASHNTDFFELLDRYLSWKLALSISVVSVAAMYFRYSGDPDPDVPMVVQLSSGLLIMKLSANIVASDKLFKVAKFLDEQAFFLYCFHAPIVISVCSILAYYILPDDAANWLVILTILAIGVVTIAACTATGILLRFLCPRIFAILTGGRVATAK